MPPTRTCRITLMDLEGTAHTTEVRASSLFEAAAAALAAFRQEGWAERALTSNATLRVEVQLPPVVHDVPLKAVERWLRSPAVSPKEHTMKNRRELHQRGRSSADAD